MKGATIFSKVDLKNAYFHIPVEKESEKILSFVTHSGQYLPLKAPFGGLPVFQGHINEVFRVEILDVIILIYMDDIIIIAKSREEAIRRLKRVLDQAAEAGLEIKWKKCEFLKTSIEFLGHIIENGTIKPSPAKIEAVRKFKEPKTLKQPQSFLGLTGSFRKFIEGYIAKPLSDLTRNDFKHRFDIKKPAAFESLKKVPCGEPVLRIYDDKAEIQLLTDACKTGLGGLLTQGCEDNEFHPVYYKSKKTSRDEEKLDSYTLETLAVIRAVKKLHVYLIGKQFTIVTDCEAFKKTMDKRDTNPKVARWVMFLQTYKFTIEHRSNRRMRHVDALSRMVMTMVTLQ